MTHSGKASHWEQYFDPHDAYRELMGGGRRKPALPVGGPAVLWHLGFWMPPDLVLQQDQWVLEIERFIRHLYHSLAKSAAADVGFQPCTRSLQSGTDGRKVLHLLNNVYPADDLHADKLEPIEGHAPRYQTFRVRFRYGGIPTSISIELNDEYFTMATTIDFAWARPGTPSDPASPQFEAVDRLKRAIEVFNDITTERLASAQTEMSEERKHKDREALSEPYDYIYRGIWNAFYRDIFDAPYRAFKNNARLGRIFTNVRGFVAAAGDQKFIVGPYEFAAKRSVAQRIGRDTFSNDDAVHRTDALLPWLKADKGFLAEDDDKDADRTEPVEFTSTLLASSRAILATALGAQLSRRRGEQAPMTYVIIPRNQAYWQFGRIVHHLNTLITLRLAALYDFHHMIKAGYELRRLDLELEQWSASTSATGSRSIRDIDIDLKRIGLQMSPDGPQIAGGLAHRCERSAYYLSQFEQFAKEMRESSIEGFPSYNAAVRRRLGGIYELIGMIGRRFGRLREEVAAINRGIMATQLLRMQSKITRQTEVIQEVQKVGDLALWQFLIPYYGTQLSLLIIEKVAGADSSVELPVIFLWIASCSFRAHRERIKRWFKGGRHSDRPPERQP